MSPTSYRTAPPRVTLRNPHCNTVSRGAKLSTNNLVIADLKTVRAHDGRPLSFVLLARKMIGHGVCDAFHRMSIVLEVLLVLSSVGLSVALSWLAVGEMFRLVRID